MSPFSNSPAKIASCFILCFKYYKLNLIAVTEIRENIKCIINELIEFLFLTQANGWHN